MDAALLWIHILAAIVGFIISGVVAGWTLKQTSPEALPLSFWRWQRVAQWITVVLGAAGTALYLTGKRPTDPLHLLYGALALLAIVLLGAFGRDRDPREFLQGWKVNPKWILFALNVFLWAMYGRGLTTGFFGV